MQKQRKTNKYILGAINQRQDNASGLSEVKATGKCEIRDHMDLKILDVTGFLSGSKKVKT